MKDKNDIPWYYWRFSIGVVFLIFIVGFATYCDIFKDRKPFDWMNIPFSAVMLLLLCWLARSEWKHRKPNIFASALLDMVGQPEKAEIQVVKSYPDRKELSTFLSPFEVIGVTAIDKENTYQVNYRIPHVWVIIASMAAPGCGCFFLPMPFPMNIIFLTIFLAMTPVIFSIFKAIIYDRLEPKKVRFCYDKEKKIFHVPNMELDMPRQDILEFSVIYGKIQRSPQSGQPQWISEFSLVYKDNDQIKRVPLFLASKHSCIKIARKLTEYTGKENYYTDAV